MTHWTRRALLFTLSAAAAAATLTAAVTPVAHGSPAGRAAPSLTPPSSLMSPGTSPPSFTSPAMSPPSLMSSSPLVWRPCEQPAGAPVPAGGQECAVLRVPLDYGDPGGRTVEVAVARLRTDRPDARRGTLFVIPGGPGSSGVQRLAQKGEALRAATEGAYDLVSLDPRGVGSSVRAGCGIPAADRHLVTLRSWPAPDGSTAANAERSRRTAELCARNGGPVLRSFTTENEVRDLDRLRGALGERKVSLWGSSYGSYVGAVYAQRYPDRVDRLVLDSTGDPDPGRVAYGWLANMAPGAAERFPDFAAWAADPAREAEGLRLARRPGDVQPLFLALARQLDRHPRASDVPSAPLTGNLLRQALQNALYSDAAFPRLARLVKEVQDPRGRPVLPPELAGPLPDEEASMTVAAVCNDVRWPGPASGYGGRVAADRARHPLTAGMPVNITPCAFWTYDEEPRPTRMTDEGPSNILMIQSLRDPSTPLAGALKMRAALGERARMVTVGQGGHGMYLGNGNACGDRVVSDFLVTGARPARDTHCPN
ncbi:alpha/beta hydrolase [Streptomyces griseus]|uniref:Alpha/beta hydrolase n=2 Tax=Streptomyces TaxID=1883 RepID=A0ABU2W9E2_9ACTN|nr:alpha/beta hydrolase [Streptomyces griseus]MDT0494495.1 alpha/beta hydrolase [Streptomyces griseus]